MKKIFTLIAAAVLAISAQAQIVSSRSVNYESGDNFTRWYLSYSNFGLTPSEGDGVSFSGVRLGWMDGIRLSSSSPVFLEVGVNGQYNAGSEGYYDYTFLKFSVPVSASYKYNFTNDFAIMPHAGLHFDGNVLGKAELKSGKGKEDFLDEGDGNRFQMGWQLGAGIVYKKLYVGVEYSHSIIEYMKNVSTHDFYVNLGVQF